MINDTANSIDVLAVVILLAATAMGIGLFALVLELKEIKKLMATSGQALTDLQTLVTNLTNAINQAVTDITDLINEISTLNGLNPAAVEAIVAQGNTALQNLQTAVSAATTQLDTTITVTVSPTTAGPIAQGATQQFTATVTNDPQNAGVTWSLSPVAAGAPTGSVSTSGLYTPPTTPGGTDTVVATSVSNKAVSASATVTF